MNWQMVEFHTNTHSLTYKKPLIQFQKTKKMFTKKKSLKKRWEGALSKPKQIKSVIGLFRRESTTSGSVAGSDPCLAAALTELAMTPPSANQPSTVAGSYRASISGAPSSEHHERHLAVAAATARGDRRRSISICAVTPIDESTEMMGVDPLGALIEFKNNDRHNKVENICKNNRRRSLFELTG